MIYETKNRYIEFLDKVAEELDIPPSKYKQAVERYKSVGKWLRDGNYLNLKNELSIHPQGSFLLGTVVRPVKEGRESDYDIDLVCQIPFEKDSVTPEEIKSMVGDRLKANEKYQAMLEKEGRRCWTLNYAEEDGIGFHLDVLPSVPDKTLHLIETFQGSSPLEKAIAITDKQENQYKWNSSNPLGFADWFTEKNKESFTRIVLNERKRIFEANTKVFANIDEVPDQLIKTPLQKSIQILKRHRDLRFVGHSNEKDKPISMIITTLSALLYSGEADTYSALKNIIEKLDAYVQFLNPAIQFNEIVLDRKIIDRTLDGKWYLPNPANPAENFADKWHENNSKKARCFFEWVRWVKEDLVQILNGLEFKKIKESLKPLLGEVVVSNASRKMLLSSSLAFQTPKVPHIEISEPNKPYSDYGLFI